MLSRTADHLYWMSRYTERAENTARMLDVNLETALLPQSAEAVNAAWEGLLSISELVPAYAQKHGAVDPAQVLQFMVADEDNPSSIVACLRAARENARAVRGALTTECWETHNQTWLELKRLLAQQQYVRDARAFFEWVKLRSHLSRGVIIGTMLKDEAFYFIRLGTFLERMDNTARLLDVKFHALQGDFYGGSGDLDQEVEFYHWSAVLRSVSAFEIYRKVYRDVIKPNNVVDLLLLRADMPRSLRSCADAVVEHLNALAPSPRSDAVHLAGKLQSELRFSRLDEIFATGLHAYLTQCLDRVATLGAQVAGEFMLGATAQ